MTRNNKNASKLKKKIILANQLNFFLLGHSVVSYGCDLGQKMASGCNRGLTDGRTDRRMDGWTARRIDGWMDGLIDGRTDIVRCRLACCVLK